jgi:8-oxo-dGTP diphosphatase
MTLPSNPEITLAGGVITDHTSGILLLHRINPGQWELPGGQVEAGEEVPAVVVRQAKQELGLEVSVGDKLGETSYVENDISFRYIWMGATILNGNPAPQEDKHDRCAYFTIHNLRSMEDISLNVASLKKQIIDGEVQLR